MAFVALVLQYLPQLVKAGVDIAPIASAAYEIHQTGRDPTPDEWALLHQREDAALADLAAAAQRASAAGG